MLLILIASVHVFANDNSVSKIAKTVDNLKQTLESECKVATKWFHKNKMIVKPYKFEAIVLDKRKLNNTEVKFISVSEQVPGVSSVTYRHNDR